MHDVAASVLTSAFVPRLCAAEFLQNNKMQYVSIAKYTAPSIKTIHLQDKSFYEISCTGTNNKKFVNRI